MLNVDKYTDFLTQLFTLMQNSNTFQFTTEPTSGCQVRTFWKRSTFI